MKPVKQPSKAKPQQPTKSVGLDKSKPTRRPPSLGKTLKLMRAQRDAMELQLEFQRDLYIELEAIEFDRIAKRAVSAEKTTPL